MPRTTRAIVVLLLTALLIPLAHTAAAQEAPVRIRVLDFGYMVVPPDPAAGPALSRAVAPLLAAHPSIALVDVGAQYRVSGMAAEGMGAQVRVDVRLVRVVDAEVVFKRQIVVDLQPGGESLADRVARELLAGMKEAKLIPER